MKFKPKFFMVFDVESIGLHGDAFSIAWVVIDYAGVKQEEGCLAYDRQLADGYDIDRLWVNENIPPIEPNCSSLEEMQDLFWNKWVEWHLKGASAVTDCGWPVETNFLSSCIKAKPVDRKWSGPYPLLDISSIMLAHGLNPVESTPRLPDELPLHHPLMDARQSARQLVELLHSSS